MTDGLRLLGERTIASGSFLKLVRSHYLAEGRPVGRNAKSSIIPGRWRWCRVIDGDVVLISQHRVAIGEDMLEIPAGKCDEPGERAGNYRAGGSARKRSASDPGNSLSSRSFYTTPGFTDELIWLYLAEELTRSRRARWVIEEEEAELVRMPIRGSFANGSRRSDRDAKTVIGLLALEKEWTA